MKTLKGILFAALVLGGIITVLVHNKAKSASTARNDKMTTFPVSALTVGKEKMEESLTMVGTITGSNDVAIVSETQGRVVSVFAKVGDYVTAGTALVQVDDEVKLSNYKAAEANYEKQKKIWRAMKNFSKTERFPNRRSKVHAWPMSPQRISTPLRSVS